MIRDYSIYCTAKGSKYPQKMAKVEAVNPSAAELAGKRLAIVLDMDFHHVIQDERKRVTQNFNKPKTKN